MLSYYTPLTPLCLCGCAAKPENGLWIPDHQRVETKYAILYWKHINYIPDENSCWPWLASTDKDGYGNFSDHTKKIHSHRFGYILQVSTIEKQLLVRHKCNNRICNRGKHLLSGTDKDNTRDMIESGNSHVHKDANKGEGNPASFLTKEEVIDIRECYETGMYTQQELADLFNISRSHVSLITLRRIWKHV